MLGCVKPRTRAPTAPLGGRDYGRVVPGLTLPRRTTMKSPAVTLPSGHVYVQYHTLCRDRGIGLGALRR
jgi:hypothetical protein